MQMQKNRPNAYQGLSQVLNPRTLSLVFLGASSGLPLALSGSTLQAWFAAENISIVAIGFLTLVGMPYLYKFLWAPLLDRFIPPFLGRRRGWMLLMQLALVIVIALMGFWHPRSHGVLLAFLALFLAFFSATQDISIDAYRTDILSPAERGMGSALFVMGYRIAMIISGGLALIVADHYGWRNTYFLMAFIMLTMTIVTFLSKEPEVSQYPVSLQEAIIAPFRDFFTRREVKWCLAFLLLYKVGDAFTISLSSAFLIKSLHYSLTVVGTVNKMVGIASSVLGGIIAGFLLARMNLYRALLWFGIGQALCSFLFMALAMVGKNLTLLAITVFADNLFSGMSAVALLVFITGLCNKKFSAAQFALFSAFASLGRVFVGPFAGVTAKYLGWPSFFFLSFFICLPGLILLWPRLNSYDAELSSQE
jgi:PAT family beta-lactamase induction signal transducer AmpG